MVKKKYQTGEKSPSFPFYVKDFLADMAPLSSSTVGIWSKLLCYMYLRPRAERGVFCGNVDQILRACGCPFDELKLFFEENFIHEFTDVEFLPNNFREFSIDFPDIIRLKNRRMVRTEKVKEVDRLRKQDESKPAPVPKTFREGSKNIPDDFQQKTPLPPLPSPSSSPSSNKEKKKRKKIRFQLSSNSEPQVEEYDPGQTPKVVRRIYEAWNLLARGTEKNPKPVCRLMPHRQLTKTRTSAIKGKLEAKGDDGSHVFTVEEIERGIKNLNQAIDRKSWNGYLWTKTDWSLEIFFQRSGGLQKFMFDEVEQERLPADIAREIEPHVERIYEHPEALDTLGLADDCLEVVRSKFFQINFITKDTNYFPRILATVKSWQGGAAK